MKSLPPSCISRVVSRIVNGRYLSFVHPSVASSPVGAGAVFRMLPCLFDPSRCGSQPPEQPGLG